MIIPKLHYISKGNTPKEQLENIQKGMYIWSGISTNSIQ